MRQSQGSWLTVIKLLVCNWVYRKVHHSQPFSVEQDGLCKIFCVWFNHNLQLEKNWSEVLKKTVNIWLWKKLSLKETAEVCVTYIYPFILYYLSILPVQFITLVRVLFHYFCNNKDPMKHCKVCYLHMSKGRLGMLDIKTYRDTLQLHLLHWMGTCDDAKTSFPSLSRMHSTEREVHCFALKQILLRMPSMHSRFYLGDRQAALRSGQCWERHYIRC